MTGFSGAFSFRLTPDLGAAKAALAAAPDLVIEELATAAVEAGLLLQREIVERTPTSGAGTLRQSIQLQPVEITATRVRATVATSLAYALPVETGSRAHWAPLAPIREWAQRRLGLSGEELEAAARRIRAAIARRGTPAVRMFERGVSENLDVVVGLFDAAIARAAARLDGSTG